MTTGRLGYNSSNDRYGLLVMDLWEIEGFHCGDTLEAPSFPPKRNDGWYLVDTPYSGTALEGLKVRVR